MKPPRPPAIDWYMQEGWSKPHAATANLEAATLNTLCGTAMQRGVFTVVRRVDARGRPLGFPAVEDCCKVCVGARDRGQRDGTVSR